MENVIPILINGFILIGFLLFIVLLQISDLKKITQDDSKRLASDLERQAENLREIDREISSLKYKVKS